MRVAFNWLVCLVVLVVALFSATGAEAQKRVALVLGNSDYAHASRLENPKNDAADMAAALEKLGFKVLKGLDLDKPATDRIIRDFADSLGGAHVGLLFYAGHGIQVGGVNYIVPIDAKLTTAASVDFELVRVDLVHRAMERETKTNIIFLDACRDNPLARNLARALGTRSTQVGRGLATIESGEGSIISFSTQPGNVALDGTGRNSPYAKALLKHMSEPGEDLPSVLINVRKDVMSETGRKQVPWEHSAMTERFVFAAKASEPPGATPANLPVASPKFDGNWRFARTSPGCLQKAQEFALPLKDGKFGARVGDGTVGSAGDFLYEGTNKEGARFSYEGKLVGAAGKGTFSLHHPQTGFSCRGTVTVTRMPQ